MALLQRNDTGSIAHLTLNAPKKLNALSEGMLEALQSEFDVLKNDQAIRAVILEGAGKAFCAGHDLKEMTAGRQAEDGGKAYFKALFNSCAKMMQTIQKLPQPVIAQVHGDAIGTRSFTGKGESDAVRLDLIAVIKSVLTITRLPNSRDMIDIDAQKNVSSGHGKKPRAFTCKVLIILLLR